MENKKIIVDSSVWISLLNDKDSKYSYASKYNPILTQEQWMPDIVFYEVLSVLKNKVSNKVLLENFIEFATESSNVVIRLFYENNREVLKIFTNEVTGTLSYVDSLLVYLSHEYEILTFDQDLKKEIKKVGGKLVEK